MFNTFPLWIKSTFIWPIERGMDWIRFRIKNYTKIQIRSLKPGYYENDTLLLHGMFQLLVDFVELEKIF